VNNGPRDDVMMNAD